MVAAQFEDIWRTWSMRVPPPSPVVECCTSMSPLSTDVCRLIASWPRHDLREKLDQGPMLAGSPSWKAGEKLANVGHDASNVFSMSWSNAFQFLFMWWFLGFEHFKLGLGTGKTNNKRWTIPDLTRKQKPTTPSYGFFLLRNRWTRWPRAPFTCSSRTSLRATSNRCERISPLPVPSWILALSGPEEWFGMTNNKKAMQFQNLT